MNLNNLRLSAKLWLAIALIVIGICAVTGITAMRSAADRLESAAALGDVSQKITLANRWVALIELNEARSQSILLSGDDQLEGVLKTPMDNTAAEVETLRRAIDASQLSVNDFVLMEKVAKARQRVLELRTQVGALRQNAQPEEAFVLLSSEYEPALAAYLKTLREFVATQTQVYKDLQGVYAQRAKTLIYFGVVGMLVLIVMILLGASWLIRSIQKPLQQANALASSIAKGDLSVQVDTGRGDEFGDLMKSMARMSESLGQMVQQVRHSTDSIALASSEIASGNNDLAQRTEQTSSNLQSAAASMDQLTQTVRHSADSARQAGTLASNASAVAEKGGEAVRQVVFTMEEINSSSRRIADIIGVIDGIAFQTNILALNAAVEAARAGEHGRGFAVVASEVRSLAQRSAEAAKEIKSLIGTSVEKVESGSRLVSDAGATMDDIVLSVRRVADVIGEISAAASEQSAGIAQVNQSVGQLDQMTQQNAALVEESAAAAESLKDQAGQLTQAVAVFRIASSGPSGVRRSPVASSGARPLTYQRAKAIERAKPLVAVQGRSAMKAVASNRPKVSGREGAGTAQTYTPSVAMSTKPASPQRPGAADADAGDWESF